GDAVVGRVPHVEALDGDVLAADLEPAGSRRDLERMTRGVVGDNHVSAGVEGELTSGWRRGRCASERLVVETDLPRQLARCTPPAWAVARQAGDSLRARPGGTGRGPCSPDVTAANLGLAQPIERERFVDGDGFAVGTRRYLQHRSSGRRIDHVLQR